MLAYYLYSALPVLVVVGIAAFVAWRTWTARRREKEILRTIASRLGLTFSEPETTSNFVRMIGGWQMSGTYNRVPVRIYGKDARGEDSRAETTFIDVAANCQRKFELTIARETTMTRLGGALFGLQDVTTGNEELDRRVVIKGVPTHVVKRTVDHPELQRELLRLFEHEGLIHVDLRGAHYRQSASFKDERSVRTLLDAMTGTVLALEKATA